MNLRTRNTKSLKVNNDSDEDENDDLPKTKSRVKKKSQTETIPLDAKSRAIKKPAKTEINSSKKAKIKEELKSEYFETKNLNITTKSPEIKKEIKPKEKKPKQSGNDVKKKSPSGQKEVKMNIDPSNKLDNIDLMLQMETMNNLKPKTENLLDNGIMSSDESDDEEEDDDDDDVEGGFEEVKMDSALELNISKLVAPGTSIEININPQNKKSKKKVDMAAKMERMFKSMQKQLKISCLKVHLLSWIAHGFYLNKLTMNKYILAMALSQPQLDIEHFQAVNFDKNQLIEFLTRTKDWLNIQKQHAQVSNKILNLKTLSETISTLKCESYLEYLLVIVLALRNLGLRVRLCLCFEVMDVGEAKGNKKQTKSTKRKQKSHSGDEETDEEMESLSDDEEDDDDHDDDEKSGKKSPRKNGAKRKSTDNLTPGTKKMKTSKKDTSGTKREQSSSNKNGSKINDSDCDEDEIESLKSSTGSVVKKVTKYIALSKEPLTFCLSLS